MCTCCVSLNPPPCIQHPSQRAAGRCTLTHILLSVNTFITSSGSWDSSNCKHATGGVSRLYMSVVWLLQLRGQQVLLLQLPWSLVAFIRPVWAWAVATEQHSWGSKRKVVTDWRDASFLLPYWSSVQLVWLHSWCLGSEKLKLLFRGVSVVTTAVCLHALLLATRAGRNDSPLAQWLAHPRFGRGQQRLEGFYHRTEMKLSAGDFTLTGASASIGWSSSGTAGTTSPLICVIVVVHLWAAVSSCVSVEADSCHLQ